MAWQADYKTDKAHRTANTVAIYNRLADERESRGVTQWDGQGWDPNHGSRPIGTHDAARQQAQLLAHQRALALEAQQHSRQIPFSTESWNTGNWGKWSGGGKKRVNKSRRVSNRRRRNKSIRRRKN
jgi:hypothetical protein